jgi:hypothetical protein
VTRTNFLRRDKHFQCPRLANQPRQALSPAPSGDQSESRAAMSERGLKSQDAYTLFISELEV